MMTKNDVAAWTRLLEKAARDKKFMNALIKDPVATAKSARVALEGEPGKQLRKFRTSLLRFGGKAKLKKQDAKNWSVGVMHHTQQCICESIDE